MKTGITFYLSILLSLGLLAELPARAAGPDIHPPNRTVERPEQFGESPSPEATGHKRGKKKLRRLGVKATGLAFSAATGELLVTVAADSAKHANTLLAVRPKTGKVLRAIPVGVNPRKLSLSDADRTAYVIVDGEAVQRVDLASGRIVSQFTPTVPDIAGPFYVAEVSPKPGSPGTVAVSLGHQVHNGQIGTAVFDDGVMRPQFIPSFTVAQLFWVGDVLWASTGDWGGRPANLRKIVVSPAGIALAHEWRSIFIGYHAVSFHDGRFYSDTGEIVDVAAEKQVGWIPGGDWRYATAHAIDPAANRIYYTTNRPHYQVIWGFDLETERYVSYYSGERYRQRSEISRMVHCGAAGLAALTGDLSPSGDIVFYPPATFTEVTPYQRPLPVAENGQVRVIPLPHNALIYDEARRKFYATMSGGNPGIGNSVVEVDPYAGSVGRDVWIGSIPGAMALTDDRQSLYVAMWGSLQVKRFRLPDLSMDLAFDLLRGPYGSFGPYATNAKEILPLPGRPGSVAILHNRYAWYREQNSEGIGVYDDGVRRPAMTDTGSPRAGSVELGGDGTTIYGLENQSSGFEFMRFHIVPAGVYRGSYHFEVGGAFFDELHCDGDRCFTDVGLVIDAAAGTRVGVLPFQYEAFTSFAVALDPERRRVYQVISGERTINVHAYDMETLRRVATLTLPGNLLEAVSCHVWDEGRQLAFSSGREIFLIPTALLRPE